MALAGAVTQIGWLFFGFGSIFFWMFAWHADLTGWRTPPSARSRRRRIRREGSNGASVWW
jgi:hypothetical protein